MMLLPDDHPDRDVVAALQRGDESVFRAVVERHHGALVRIARHYVSTDGAAEEVTQEAWLSVIDGLPRFEGRSSLRTWMVSIVVNKARDRSRRDQRMVPLSSIVPPVSDDGPTVDADRFLDATDPDAGHWAMPPQRVDSMPEAAFESTQLLAAVRAAIDELPPNYHRVLWLRDVEGLTSAEVCAGLDLSEANQRVLLHRARSKVRAALERRLEVGVP